MPVRPIDSLLPRSSRNFGGKARNLAALVRAGFPVPAAFAVSGDAAVQTFESVLPRELCPSQIFALPDVPEAALAEARERILGADLAPPLVQDLQRAFDTLRAAGADGVAVRSSSTSEDLATSSAAGLHTTVLNVRTPAALLDAVRNCYAGVFSPRVATYVQSLGVEALSSMGIVIQAMVPADVAGVLFTVNPLTGDPDEMVIDASYGLGTQVTDGRVAPDTYRIEKRSGWVRDRVTGDKRFRTVAARDGGLVQESVPSAQAQKQALDEHMLAQLVSLGRRIEEHFGDARDVEFAIAADSIYVLQARAVTALAPRSQRARPKRRGKTLATDATTVVWSNLNVGEALPGVATPLTWSILSQFSELGFRNAFAALGCKVPKDVRLVGNFRGRIYLNLTELTRIAAQVPGLRPSLVLPLGGGGEAERLERDMPGPSAGFLLRLPATAARFTRANIGFSRRVTSFEAAFDAERRRIECIDFRILPASALDETLSDVHRLLDEAGTILLTAYGGLLSALLPLRGVLTLLKGADANRIQHALLSAISDVESAGPAREILGVAAAFERDAAARERLQQSRLCTADELPPGEALRAVQGFLRLYGHRGVREADLAEPRWRENPRLLFDAVRMHLEHGIAESESRMQSRIAAARAAADAALSSVPRPVRLPLRALLSVVRDYVRVRERLRSHVVHVLGLFRLVGLDASRRLSVREPDIGPDAAFFLTLNELHGVLRGEIRSVAALVRLRRAQLDRDRSLPDPPDTFVGYPPALAALPDDGECLQGLGASSGAVEGSVRVLRSIDEITKLLPGEILVVSAADVGWSPVFPVAGGLVTDLGGPLSHACVVAREYGLPTVVNVRSATRALKTGDRVRLDGDSGIVQRLAP
jgi:phosphohistidine swiveling domain-containing protein